MATRLPRAASGNEQDWDFNGPSFTASVSKGTNTVTMPKVNVSIANDSPLDSVDAALINTILGAGAVSVGDPIDAWDVSGLTSGAFFNNDNLVGGIEFELVFLKFGTPSSPPTLFTDLTYQPLAPTISSADLTVFLIEEADDTGTTLFSALGTVNTSSSVIPEPATLGILTLLMVPLVTRRRTTRVSRF